MRTAHPSTRRAGASAALMLAAGLFLTACAGESATPAAAPSSGMDMGGKKAGHPAAPACPPLPKLDTPPKRIVTMDGGAAAILTELGLGDRIVGTAAPDFFAAFPADKKAALDKIPVLDPGQGNAEKVVNAHPDLVVGLSTYSFGGFDGTPTVDRLAQAGAKALVACESAGGAPVKDLSVTTKFITDAADVLGVAEKGKQLAAQVQSAVDGARSGGGAPVRVLAVSGPPAPGQPVMTQGGTSLANGVITLAGGKNIAEEATTDFASLSSEEVAARDPQAIVVISGFAPGSDADLTAAIRSSPVLAGSTAVKENRLVVVPQSILLSPSVLNGQAVATIAAALRKPAG
ncbi:ABC transporter substrate-binding protein [Amycolatopsis sp. NPDC059021]|uniref:ABC transporter substrate-binding protein n=1 Tax=Amycolatopsis sp. NPDC059021 TaxID=3346704 RepID=UPI00366EDC8D